MTKSPTTGNVVLSRAPMSSVTGVNLSTRMRVVWGRGKANINRLLGNGPPNTRLVHESACRFPYDIVEMIIVHIAHDLDTLKACSMTCRSWYITAIPHLHHTLILRRSTPGIPGGELKPLSELHRLGLTPLIKEIRVMEMRAWFVPRAFRSRDLRSFSAFANVQNLTFQHLDISLFIPDIKRYFGHFAPALRSLTLLVPCCTPRQLSHFLSLFPNLDDIMIWHTPTPPPNTTIPDTKLVPFSTPRLRGRLVLYYYDSVETWTPLIASGGGLRFRFMDLCRIRDSVPVLLEACAETLETLRFCTSGSPIGDHPLPPLALNLSRLKVLRSLEVGDWAIDLKSARHTTVTKAFSTIVSPVFSELVIIIGVNVVTSLPSEVPLFETLRRMNGLRPFKLVFLLVDPDLPPGEAQRKLEDALVSVTARGLLDFLDSPPTIRNAQIRGKGQDQFIL